MSSKKEKDVLERQRQLAALMAGKTKRPSQTINNNNTNPPAPPPPWRNPISKSNDSDTSDTPATIKAGGLTLTKQRARPGQRRPSSLLPPKPAATSASADVVIDSTKGASNTSSTKKVIGIHKSFKRLSPAAVMAAARAKAKKLEEVKNENCVDDEQQDRPSKKPRTDEGVDGKEGGPTDLNSAKLARKVTTEKANRLASLVQNVVAKKDDPSGCDDISTSFSVNITTEDFWKNIRNWDFVIDLAKQQLENNSYSKNGINDDSESKVETKKPVPETFINTRHYVSVWAPLCLAECRSQILSDVLTECGQMNPRNSPFVLVDVEATWKTNRKDRNFVHSELTEMIDSCQVVLRTKHRGDGNRLQFFPHDICCLVPVEKKDMVENLLLRSGGQRSNTNTDSKYNSNRGFQDDAFGKSCMVGHTEAHRSQVDGLILKVSKRKWAQVGSSEMYLLRMGSNITALREFTALCHVDMLGLKHYLLGQHLDETKHNNVAPNRALFSDIDLSDPNHKEALLKKMGGVEALGKGFTQYAHKKFNPSQLMAISASSQGYGDGGFTLIKGPPGTGRCW
jgi:senataxin